LPGRVEWLTFGRMKSFIKELAPGIALCGFLFGSASVAAPSGMADLERAMDEAAGEILEAELEVAGVGEGALEAAKDLTIREALDLAIEHAPEGSGIRSIERLEADHAGALYYAVYGETIVTRTVNELQADGGYAPEPRHRAVKVGVLVGQEGTVKKAVTEDKILRFRPRSEYAPPVPARREIRAAKAVREVNPVREVDGGESMRDGRVERFEIRVTEEGYQVDGEAIDGTALKELVSELPETRAILIRARADLSYRRMKETLAILSQAGLKNVQFATEQ